MFDPVALLTLFVRRSMALMNFIAPVEKIDGIMFTVDEPDDRMVEILLLIAANLGLKTSHVYLQSHTESFYSFMLHQPSELWYHQVLACEHDGMRLKLYRMECNKHTTPVVVLIEEQMHIVWQMRDFWGYSRPSAKEGSCHRYICWETDSGRDGRRDPCSFCAAAEECFRGIICSARGRVMDCWRSWNPAKWAGTMFSWAGIC